MASRGELYDVGVLLVFRQLFGAQPVGAQEVRVIAALVVRPAEERREVELLAGDALPHAVVAVQVVVELAERAVP